MSGPESLSWARSGSLSAAEGSGGIGDPAAWEAASSAEAAAASAASFAAVASTSRSALIIRSSRGLRFSPIVLSARGDITVEADIGLLSEGTPAESAHTDASACACRKSALAWAISTAVFIVLASSFSSYRIRLAFR